MRSCLELVNAGMTLRLSLRDGLYMIEETALFVWACFVPHHGQIESGDPQQP
jgi:hypothetical protein